MMKILLCTDGSSYSQVSYEYCAWLAMYMDVEIEVLYVTDLRKEKAVQTQDFSGSIGIDSYQQLLDDLVELERDRAKINQKQAKYILEQAEAFLSSREINNIKLTHETGFLVDLFHNFEANADLIILGKRGEAADFATEHLGANMERIVRASHKPCLVTPREFKQVNRVLLAYDGGKSCQKALKYLIELPVFKDLEFHIITIAHRDKKAALNHLKTAEKTALAANLEPTCQLLTGEPEVKMEKYINNHDIDFLIMGAYGHNRIRHLVIGSTTAQMLRSSQIPVLLFR
ncbi:MAG: universal stress protein [Xenococcaceae cyanobacterium MO_167.B52]|nr:universal stress protein [Xenococcaceae cyanobacterium MO_167.B52]